MAVIASLVFDIILYLPIFTYSCVYAFISNQPVPNLIIMLSKCGLYISYKIYSNNKLSSNPTLLFTYNAKVFHENVAQEKPKGYYSNNDLFMFGLEENLLPK